jgi:hypothetical protein
LGDFSHATLEGSMQLNSLALGKVEAIDMIITAIEEGWDD